MEKECEERLQKIVQGFQECQRCVYCSSEMRLDS